VWRCSLYLRLMTSWLLRKRHLLTVGLCISAAHSQVGCRCFLGYCAFQNGEWAHDCNAIVIVHAVAADCFVDYSFQLIKSVFLMRQLCVTLLVKELLSLICNPFSCHLFVSGSQATLNKPVFWFKELDSKKNRNSGHIINTLQCNLAKRLFLKNYFEYLSRLYLLSEIRCRLHLHGSFL